jgi:hypothetical protein
LTHLEKIREENKGWRRTVKKEWWAGNDRVITNGRKRGKKETRTKDWNKTKRKKTEAYTELE